MNRLDVYMVIFSQLKKRYNKILPALEGKTLTAFITQQPLNHVNPNNPNDPYPYRLNSNSRFSREEIRLLGELFKEAHKEREKKQPPVISNGWDPETPLYTHTMKNPLYEGIPTWINICKRTHGIGSCTSRFKIQGSDYPLVKRGEKGVVIDSTAKIMLPDFWRKAVEKVPSNYLWVIFNEHIYFIDAERVKKLKYNMQPQFI